MIFLPVAERELRVASRKPSTTRTRVLGALAALVIALVFLGIFSFRSFATSSPAQGQVVFKVLLWLTFAAALGSGLFLTADAISEEKREGTFGLLFLTDLSGFDVVLGKLLASSLVGFYALLAVFPVLAIPLLLGGVTGAEFWKSIVALVSTMLLSLSCGLFVSALNHGSHRAMLVTFGILTGLTVGGPLLDSLLAEINPSAALPFFSLISPGFLLSRAQNWMSPDYVQALAVNQAMAGLCLLGAILMAPRRWQDRVSNGPSPSFARRKPANERATNHSRRGAEERSHDAVHWLHCRLSGSRRLVWAWAGLLAAGTVALILTAAGNDLQGWSMLSGFFALPLYLLASMSGRFLLEGRRSGSLELLLTTPLSPREIITGQWRGCRRQFGLAILLLVLAQTTLSVASTWQMWIAMAGIRSTAPPSPGSARGSAATPASPVGTSNSSSNTSINSSTNVVVTVQTSGVWISRNGMRVAGGMGTQSFGWLEMAGAVGVGALSGATTLLNLAALFWFGMWRG